jgi:hypothetical protein
MQQYMQRHLAPLVGRKIVGLLEDEDDETRVGFQLDNGMHVWVLQDPEGNGPGFLEIEKP